MLNKSKFISYNKKTFSNKGLEAKYNKSGKNSSGKIVIRFKSKSNIKKIFIQDFFNRSKSIDFIVFNRVIHNSKSLFSSYIMKKDIIYPLGLLVKNFSYQIIKYKINNFIYFVKRLFFSKELFFKINFYNILVIIKNRLEFFFNICLEKLHVGERIKKLDLNSKKSQTLDLNIVKNFYENNLICNINFNNKRYFVSPFAKGRILHIGESFSLVLTPQKKILKIPSVSIGQLFGTPYLRKCKVFHKKASRYNFFKSKPRVLGKSMNICDHPNGGYKRSSKILKNFKSQLICK